MYKLSYRFLKDPIFQTYLIRGVCNTLFISACCMVGGFVLGLLIALCRRSKVKPLQWFGFFWVDILRNTPFLVQLMFLYFGLPQIGIPISPMAVVILALCINTSAVHCEVIRAGLMAVKKGYYECSLALGYSMPQTLLHVVIPISIRVAFKPLVSNFINLVLTSSIAFSVTVMDLMGAAKVINGRTDRPFEIYLMLLVIYCIITFIISSVSKVIDKKIAIQL